MKKYIAVFALCLILSVLQAASAPADGLQVNAAQLLLYPKQQFRLISEADGVPVSGVSYMSGKPAVASVSGKGVVTAKKKGSTTITLKDAAGRTLKVKVRVKSTPSISLPEKTIRLATGETYSLTPDANLATGATVPECTWKYKSNKKSIASVSAEGVVTAVKPGTATITVSNNLGAKTKVTVQVVGRDTTYRALLIANESYPESGRNRPCAVNARNALTRVLGSAAEPYQITQRKDLTDKEFDKVIEEAFRGADEDDVSLFYYAGHGSGTGLKCSFDRVYPYVKLFSALNTVPGRVILILDTCRSGAVLTSGGDAEDASLINSRIIDIFRAGGTIPDYWGDAVASSGFRTDKFQILTACTSQEGSYNLRLSGVYINAFTYALCRGMGWDASDKKACTPFADENRDSQITMREAHAYASVLAARLVRESEKEWQTAQIWPANSRFVLCTVQ